MTVGEPYDCPGLQRSIFSTYRIDNLILISLLRKALGCAQNLVWDHSAQRALRVLEKER